MSASTAAGIPLRLASGVSPPLVSVASGCGAVGTAGVSTSSRFGGSGRGLLTLLRSVEVAVLIVRLLAEL